MVTKDSLVHMVGGLSFESVIASYYNYNVYYKHSILYLQSIKVSKTRVLCYYTFSNIYFFFSTSFYCILCFYLENSQPKSTPSNLAFKLLKVNSLVSKKNLIPYPCVTNIKLSLQRSYQGLCKKIWLIILLDIHFFGEYNMVKSFR